MKRSILALVLVWSAGLLGCDEQQYVSPDTVALVVTDDATNMQRVNRCLYVPVLLGSQVTFRYEVADDIKATLVITRDEAVVSFEPDGVGDTFRVDTEELTEMQTHVADAAPSGYTVELTAGCTPDDDDFR